MNWNKPQSGTNATDHYRESRGMAAAAALLVGRGMTCVSGDHLNGNELCVEVIARKGNDDRTCVSNSASVNTAGLAVHNLRAGNGYHKKQSDHGGGNTCAAVIAASTG